MIKYQSGGEQVESDLRVKIRLDFKGVSRPGRLFGGKPTEKVAEEIREQQVALFRNVPVQGVRIEDINLAGEIYTIFDEKANSEVAFAPLELTVVVASLEDLLRFVIREEFRRVEILEPAGIILSRFEMERLLFKINEEVRGLREWLEHKYNR